MSCYSFSSNGEYVKKKKTPKKKTKKYAFYQEKIKELFKDQKISLDITNTMKYRKGNDMFTLKSDVDVEECTDYWTIAHYKTKNIQHIGSKDRWKHAECTIYINQAEDQVISDKLNKLMKSIYNRFMRNRKKIVNYHAVKYNTTLSLNIERYLHNLEENCSLPEVIKIPPPEISNFYWKNNYGNKYKAFIPTPARNVYYNLEEYVGEMELKEIKEEGWKFAEKCVLLAVSNKCPKDQPFIDHMEFLIANFAVWGEQNNDHWENIGYDVQYKDYRHTNRHYIITEYFVDDLKDVPMQLRGKCGRFRGAITISPEHDNAKVIYAMNIAFQLTAKRFANDKDLGVYAYGHKYLHNLEENCSLPEVIKIPPPEISNFYWKNDYGNKYKAFIPTPDRIVYYNLEEYSEFMSIAEIDGFGWRFTKKCVLLAVSELSDIYTEDQPFINQMELLISNLTARRYNRAENLENVELCDQQYKHYKHMNRHYVLTKYFVEDIKNVKMEDRGLKAKFKGTLTITSEHDGDERIIYAMNTAFELAAKRFSDDINLKVYSYQRR